MSDVGDNNFVRYIYRGEADEEVPEDTTHITVHEDVKVVLRYAFCYHQNIIEIICHDKVERIEQEAFVHCIPQGPRHKLSFSHMKLKNFERSLFHFFVSREDV